MLSPGSIPEIPEQATIKFEEKWDFARPGVKRRIAFLPLSNGRRLTVFPHREWDAPVGVSVECVIYPLRNAAVAAPIGGIPDDERLEVDDTLVHTESHGGRVNDLASLAARLRDLASECDNITAKLDELADQLQPANHADTEDEPHEVRR